MTNGQASMVAARFAEFLTHDEAALMWKEPFDSTIDRAVARGHEFAIKKHDDGSIGLCVRPASGICSWTFAKP